MGRAVVDVGELGDDAVTQVVKERLGRRSFIVVNRWRFYVDHRISLALTLRTFRGVTLR